MLILDFGWWIVDWDEEKPNGEFWMLNGGLRRRRCGGPPTRFAAPAGQGGWSRVDADGGIGVPIGDGKQILDFGVSAVFISLLVAILFRCLIGFLPGSADCGFISDMEADFLFGRK